MSRKSFKSSISLLCCVLFASTVGFGQNTILKKGEQAPAFSAKASLAGKTFNFSLKKALKKGPVVLYFFPAAYTRGCDIEAHTFSEMKNKFDAAGATIIGVSADNIKRLNQFSSDSDYCAGNFSAASDLGGKIAAKYGLHIIHLQKTMKDSKGQVINHGFIPRTTFVINKSGKIVAVFSTKYDHISPEEHVEKSLKIVNKLKAKQ